MEESAAKPRPWAWYAVVVLAFLAAAGLGSSWLLLSRWSSIENPSPAGASAAFDRALDGAGGGAPYIEIGASGAVTVHRELEVPGSPPLATLHLLAWDPGLQRLLRVSFPFWFVRLKMSETLNLGTLTAALARDWGNLDLEVTEEDLQRRGPGLVLHLNRPDGGRLLLWTE